MSKARPTGEKYTLAPPGHSPEPPPTPAPEANQETGTGKSPERDPPALSRHFPALKGGDCQDTVQGT